MTNSELQRLIKEYSIWDEDAVEILRIFEIMTDSKKIEILENWPKIAAQIKFHREQIEKEKEVLLMRALDNIEKEIDEYNKKLVEEDTKNELKFMKKKNNKKNTN